MATLPPRPGKTTGARLFFRLPEHMKLSEARLRRPNLVGETPDPPLLPSGRKARNRPPSPAAPPQTMPST